MVICSCNVITDKQIEEAVQTLARRDPGAKLSTCNVQAEIGCRPECCGCVPHFKRLARQVAGG